MTVLRTARRVGRAGDAADMFAGASDVSQKLSGADEESGDVVFTLTKREVAMPSIAAGAATADWN